MSGWPHKRGTSAKVRFHYERDFRCVRRCGAWVKRAGDTCAGCLLKAEQKNAATTLRKLRKRLDPGRLCDDDGRPV